MLPNTIQVQAKDYIQPRFLFLEVLARSWEKAGVKMSKHIRHT
jgi:hypothetical protein